MMALRVLMSLVIAFLPLAALADVDKDALQSVRDGTEWYQPGCNTDASSGSAVTAGDITYIAAGNIPKEGKTYKASLYGTQGNKDSSGKYVEYLGGIEGGASDEQGKPLKGRIGVAELKSNSALGGLPYGTKIEVTYKGRSVIAEVTDNGPATQADVDIWRQTADILKFPNSVEDVTVHAVDPKTPVTKVGDEAITADSSGGGGSSTGAGDTNKTDGNSEINKKIEDVAKKYDLQSAQIQQVGKDVLGGYKADEHPATPASTMKLIIADALLRKGIDLDKSITVTGQLKYDGTNDLNGQPSSITLRSALQQMLSKSSNTAANVIMNALGGPGDFTKLANSYGYTHTDVNFYYSSSAIGKNKSTISDQVAAMSHLFTAKGAGYDIAQAASREAAKSDNHYNIPDDANKWAGTDNVAGNVGLFTINTDKYIIGLYYNGGSETSKAQTAIKQGTADLLKIVKDNPSTGGQATGGDGCCTVATGGDVPGNADGSTSGVWNSGLKPPYIVEQFAIEVLKNLAQKKGAQEGDAVTEQHVLALSAWAIMEGGDIMNHSLYNLYNTGYSDPALNDGAHTTNGLGSYKSFDAGVEATARTIADKGHKGMAAALLKKDSTAQDFAHAESYTGTPTYPGTSIWAEGAAADPSGYEKNTWGPALRTVKGNYKAYAGLVIGTEEFEQQTNKTEPSKLQFNGGSADTGSLGRLGGMGCDVPSADASGIVRAALEYSWPESHGTTPTEAYKKAYLKYNPNGPGMADCGGFVATVMHATGADPDYPAGGTSDQEKYVRSSGKYDVIDSVKDFNPPQVQPGDIFIVNSGDGNGASGHTYIYVGNQPPNNYDEASASLGSRAANLGKAIPSDWRGNYLRARLK